MGKSVKLKDLLKSPLFKQVTGDEEALERALGDIPYFYDADIGHTIPTMTFINGAICHLDYQDKKASIKFELK